METKSLHAGTIFISIMLPLMFEYFVFNLYNRNDDERG